MDATTNLDSWVQRGRELLCFPDDISMARYYAAWSISNVEVVKTELERIFCTVFPMPGINWLAYPTLMQHLDGLQDGPKKLPEDWDHGDFIVTSFSGEVLHPSWLCADGEIGERWSYLIANFAKEFIYAKCNEKVILANSAVRRIRVALSSNAVSFQELVRSAAKARFIELTRDSSPELDMLAPDDLHAQVLILRAESVALAWWKVLGMTLGEGRPLTLAALRRCPEMLSLDTLLSSVLVPETRNLINFLRCADYDTAPNYGTGVIV